MRRQWSLQVLQVTLIANMPELPRKRFHLAFLWRINQYRMPVAGKHIRRAHAKFKLVFRERFSPAPLGWALFNKLRDERLFRIEKRKHSGLPLDIPVECREPLPRRSPLNIHGVTRCVASEPISKIFEIRVVRIEHRREADN